MSARERRLDLGTPNYATICELNEQLRAASDASNQPGKQQSSEFSESNASSANKSARRFRPAGQSLVQPQSNYAPYTSRVVFESKPDPRWSLMFRETREDLARDAAIQAAYVKRMRHFSGQQVSRARLALNIDCGDEDGDDDSAGALDI